MTNYILIPTKNFNSEFDKLSQIDQQRVLDKDGVIAGRPVLPVPAEQKTTGESRPLYFESSVSMSIRLIWRYDGEKIIVMLDVGHHDVLKKY